MYIAIAGNIGSGKTSLTEILANRTGARAYYEDSDCLLYTSIEEVAGMADVITIEGDCTTFAVLKKAAVRKADLFIACLLYTSRCV